MPKINERFSFLIGALIGIFWLSVIALIIISSGCAGARKTSREPLHAESGGGITIWKIPIIGFGGWGTSGAPDVIIHKYDYTAKPAPTPPGAPPSMEIPAPVDYPTIYNSTLSYDPSLVIFRNEFDMFPVRFQIDNKPEFQLEPHQSTANIHFTKGKHIVRVRLSIPTGLNEIWEINDIYTFSIETISCPRLISISGYIPSRLYFYERCLN
ncbi:MAG: hypothetical protein AAB366_03230 [Patescibacteria group bacterium]